MRIFTSGVLCFLFWGSMTSVQAASTPEAAGASSIIPERRDFPINPQINPCDNFYEHACSAAIHGFKMRDDRSSHMFAFSDSRERILDKKKDFLKQLEGKFKAKEPLSPRSQTLATLYGACMNGQARQQEEEQLVKQTLSDLEAITTRAAFLSYMAKQRDQGQFSFIDLGTLANQDRPEFNDLYFSTSMMSLPERSYYLKSEVATDYLKTIEAFFTTIHDKQPKKHAKAVLKLETEFAKNHPLPAEMREIYSRKSSISKADLRQKYANFRLLDVLPRVPDQTNIRHFTPETYAFVERTLSQEPLDNLKALYAYQALSPVMDDAFPDFFKDRLSFRQKHLGEPPVRPDRQERCTQLVMRTYNKELDAEVLPLMFPDFPEEKFIALAEKVRGSIIQGVQQNQWLTADGKKGAIEKMSKAKLQLVKPSNDAEWYFNPPVSFAADRPLDNMARLERALLERMFNELPVERNRQRWAMGPLTVNAYYSSSDNKFVMPIGILQYPFYDPKLPLEVNLGAVGAVIGHELGHGIDDQGAKYDATGKLRQWMSDDDVKNFKARGRKLVEQFDQIGHNGELTLGENIGDLTGVTFAFQAAFPAGKGTQAEKRAFYLQYARVWCGVELPKLSEQLLKVDPHSRGWARVNQQMKNQTEFATAFECKKNDPMVLPEGHTVHIW